MVSSVALSKEQYRLSDGRSLCCMQTVRLLPGRRRACFAELDGQPVFAKIFLDSKRGKVHYQRELAGIRAFEQGGILTAKLLYAGELAETCWPVLLLARILSPLSLKKAWDSAEYDRREAMLQAMIRLLSSHHRAGIIQTDLHLDNFVVSGSEIYSLDGAGVRYAKGEIGRQGSLANLALFLAQLDPAWESSIPEVYRLYLAERGWRCDESSGYLRLLIQKARKKRWQEVRGKLFRDCTDFVVQHAKGRLEIFSRQDDMPELRALLADPDPSFPGKQQALKCGNTCTVWATVVVSLRLVIKRYNIKSFWHGLKLSIRRGRALTSWENAHRLQFYGIATPRPVAVLKQRQGLLRPVSYFMMEEVLGKGAEIWFRDTTISTATKRYMVGEISLLISKMQNNRISHGDMKASNFLITDQGPMMIDLDAMRQHRSERTYRKARRRDLNRFMRNWREMPALKELFNQTLEEKGVTF